MRRIGWLTVMLLAVASPVWAGWGFSASVNAWNVVRIGPLPDAATCELVRGDVEAMGGVAMPCQEDGQPTPAVMSWYYVTLGGGQRILSLVGPAIDQASCDGDRVALDAAFTRPGQVGNFFGYEVVVPARHELGFSRCWPDRW